MKHSDVLADLQSWQKDEKDTREDVRESFHFLDDKDGQWEQSVWDKKKNSPRYTFDKCNFIVDLICGPIEESTFSIKTSPSNLNGNSEFCEQLNGIIRGIERTSDAQDIYNRSIRKVVKGGFDAWMPETRYRPGSFNQEFVFKQITNAVDRVWISPDSIDPTSADAKCSVLLTFIPWGKYQERYPKAEIKDLNESQLDVDDGVQWDRYWYKPEGVTIGTYFYEKAEEVELALLDNGSVIELNKTVAERLELEDRKVVKTRKDKKSVWYSRDFSQKEWLSEPKLLPWKSQPIITLYGNYDVNENKRVYRGAILKLMDAQRVLNYAKSREIEESALAPRKKIMATRSHFKSKENRAQLARMNTSSDPVQFYDHVENVPQPYETGGPSVNPQLNLLSQNMAADIESVAGKWAAQLGKNPMNQSGVALQSQIDQAALSDTKWGLILERAIRRLFTLIIEAMPSIIDVQDSLMSIDEAGKVSFVNVNEPVKDEFGVPVYQNGSAKLTNEITSDYAVDVTIGPAYGSAQKQANAALLELAAVKPEVLQRNGDLFMSNIQAPGMSLAVERERQALLQSGQIPVSQMTDEEKEALQQQANQPQEPDANAILAQAEMLKGQAQMAKAQVDMENATTDRLNAETKRLEAMIKAQESGVKIENVQADTAKKVSEIDKNNAEVVNKQLDSVNKFIG